MSVVILLQGDKLRLRACVKEGLDMFEEPGLVPQPDLVEFVGVGRLHHVAGHHGGLVPAEHHALHEVMVVGPLQLPLQSLDHLLEGVDGDVVQLDEPPARDDVDLDAGEEPDCAVTPGDREEELGVRVGGALHDGAIHENKLIAEKGAVQDSIKCICEN